MKRVVIALLCLLAIGLGMQGAEKAKIEFEKKVIDLGNITADGGKVTFNYPFVNKGDAPLVILSVSNGGCGCTKPSFPKAPIKPGATGTISITFDPTGRRGELNRTVKVRTNGTPGTVQLRFKGSVVGPKR